MAPPVPWLSSPQQWTLGRGRGGLQLPHCTGVITTRPVFYSVPRPSLGTNLLLPTVIAGWTASLTGCLLSCGSLSHLSVSPHLLNKRLAFEPWFEGLFLGKQKPRQGANGSFIVLRPQASPLLGHTKFASVCAVSVPRACVHGAQERPVKIPGLVIPFCK